jgi:hypothetical protein
MTTINASSSIGIDLNPACYSSPVVIGAGVTITNPGFPYGVYRDPGSTVFFTVQNDGTIAGSASAPGVGVDLAPGGSVTNAASASIAGYTGVDISGGTGTVDNGGRIAGGGGGGIIISGGTGTVVNDGSVTGGGFSALSAINLGSGGSVTNAATASIAGYRNGVYLGGAGTVVNYGSISATHQNGVGVNLDFGGSVTNAAGASITGRDPVVIDGGGIGVTKVSDDAPGTVVNAGTIGTGSANLSNYGVDLFSPGLVTNAGGATIMGINAIECTDSASVVTIINNGDIIGLAGPTSSAYGSFGPSGTGVEVNINPTNAVIVLSVINGASASIVGNLYGVNLAEHDVLLAEGLPAESFLDMRDGTNYANRAGPARLYPDYSARMWEAFGCARLVVTGPEPEAARALVAGFAINQAAA